MRGFAPFSKAAKEAAELAEKNKVPKVAVTLPPDAKDVKQTKDEIKFSVGKGKAKAAVEALRAQFREAGWKENFRFSNRHERRSLFLKRRRAECDPHVHRHAYYADRGQSVGDARRARSCEVKSEVRSKKEEVTSDPLIARVKPAR
jgi:hypothetical protein